MKVRKLLFSTLILVLLLALTLWLALRLSLPRLEGEALLPGVDQPVTVSFDTWQRPYVGAANLGDALAAQGWLHARNRLWQMELFRRAGKGRMAELLGADLVATDRELWRAGVPQLARKLLANAGAETLRLVDRYLDGVNAGIAEYLLLPPEFMLLGAERPEWRREDVFALGALMAFQSANNMANELLRLALVDALDGDRLAVFQQGDGRAASYPFVIPAAGVTAAFDRLALTDPDSNPLMPRLGFGSNGWVVAAERSKEGVPLFAFDSHDDLGLPNLFYEVHLFYGAGKQLRGWSVAGLPGVINGFNSDIAWGFTNIGDTQDLFLETRHESDPLLFRDGDEWYRADTETVVIPIAGGEEEQLTIIHTRNGPLISEEPALSLAWTVHRIPRPSLDSMLAFNLAEDWQQFTAALDRFPAPTLNATYADRHGTIGFRTGGVIPRRGAGQGLLPLDGSVPANRWQGLVEAHEMPQRSNPASGFLAAANARVNAPGEGPLVSADNAAPYRIARIQQVLAGEHKISSADMQRLQVDWTDGQAQLLLPVLLRDLSRDELGSGAAAALALLEGWQAQPVASPDSGAALVFPLWYLEIAREVFAVELGDVYPRLLRRSYLLNQALDTLLLQETGSIWWRGERGSILARTLSRTVEQLSQQLGGEPRTWRLDDLQRVELHHELASAVPELGVLFNQSDQPWGGGAATVGRARYSYARPLRVDSGATVRVVAAMHDVPRVAAVISGGQSGHPLSKYYSDQYHGWLAGELYPVAVGPDAPGGATLILRGQN